MTVRLFAVLIFLFSLSACAPGTVAPAGSTQVTAPVTASPAPTAAAPEAPTRAPTARQDTAVPAAPLPLEETPSGSPFQGPLSVIIQYPPDNSTVQTDRVELTGEADPGTVISIDDEIVVVGQDRKFSVPLALEEGPNVFEITASDPDGNQATVYLTVTYDPQH